MCAMESPDGEAFNGLTPAQAERLAMLAEECAEVVAAVSKILRHGYGSCNPNRPIGPNNRAILEREIGDVRAIVLLMAEARDVSDALIRYASGKKLEELPQYTYHQPDRLDD